MAQCRVRDAAQKTSTASIQVPRARLKPWILHRLAYQTWRPLQPPRKQSLRLSLSQLHSLKSWTSRCRISIMPYHSRTSMPNTYQTRGRPDRIQKRLTSPMENTRSLDMACHPTVPTHNSLHSRHLKDLMLVQRHHWNCMILHQPQEIDMQAWINLLDDLGCCPIRDQRLRLLTLTVLHLSFQSPIFGKLLCITNWIDVDCSLELLLHRQRICIADAGSTFHCLAMSCQHSRIMLTSPSTCCLSRHTSPFVNLFYLSVQALRLSNPRMGQIASLRDAP